MMKRIRFGVLYALAMIGLVVAVDYALYWRYVATLEEHQKPKRGFDGIPHVSATTLRRVGAFNNDTLSVFTRFTPAKPEGVIRVGVFGGSHANAAEVDEFSDFPSQLAGLLEREGHGDVEILNFASAAHGMTQSYILWDEVGRRFGLDAILFAPRSYDGSRDTSFNHSQDDSPYFLHSRFVMDGGELSRIDVIGDTHDERFRRYFSFLTPWRYLRYDRNDPPFLAAALPEGKVLENPFYHDRRSTEDEASEIQRQFLRRMIASGTQVVLSDYPRSDRKSEVLEKLGGEQLCAASIERPLSFPYIAPLGHNAPSGNAFIARQYLALLLGRPVAAPLIKTAPLEPASVPGRLPATRLDEYEDARVYMNGVDAGRFSGEKGAEEPTFLRDRGVRALLAIRDEGSSVLDGLFLAFGEEVDTAAPMRLVLHSSRGEESVPLARLPEARDELHLGAVALPGLETKRRSRVGVSANALERLFGGSLPSGTLRLFVGDRMVLEGETDPDMNSVELAPIGAGLYRLRGTRSGDASADRGSATGLAELVLRHGGETVSVPLARWWIEQHAMDPAASCPPEWRPPLPSARLSNDLRQSAP